MVTGLGGVADRSNLPQTVGRPRFSCSAMKNSSFINFGFWIIQNADRRLPHGYSENTVGYQHPVIAASFVNRESALVG